MFTNTTVKPDQGHAHGVDLEATFDFLNTADIENGFPVEKLPSLDDALDWFLERGLIHHEGADRIKGKVATDPEAVEKGLDRVHDVRDALREVAEAIVEKRVPKASALATVNRTLHARQVIELVPGPEGCYVDHRHIGDPIDDALARIADPLVSELTGGTPERIRICASDTCQWIFYDASRTGRRRWCDMATCGNRAKAARYRARAKEEAIAAESAESGRAN